MLLVQTWRARDDVRRISAGMQMKQRVRHVAV
jgi:hypothetical protein